MRKDLLSKTLVMGVVVLFVGVSITTSTGKIDTAKTSINDGSLLGYVNDTSGNPIEGALVRVHFHETYEEDYSDEDGYYHVTNIPICYCLKNVSCSKDCYKTEWVLLSIVENTTHDFILNTTNHPPKAPKITGPGNIPSDSIKGIVMNPVNFPPGKPIEFRFEAIDPDGDDIRYHIDWGDGDYEITRFYPSGVEVKVNHTFNCQGTYTVSARAEDTCGFTGPWGTMSIPIWSISTEDNNENEPVDDYEEIITRIRGDCTTVTRTGFLYNEPIEIDTDFYYYSFEVKGLKKPVSGIFDIFFKEYPSNVKASRFYGWATNFLPGVFRINGIALGNIEWS